MAISNTTFAERLQRVEHSAPQMFVGDDTPQAFSPDQLVCASKKRGAFHYSAILLGLIIGAAVGYAFSLIVGFDLLITQPPLMIYYIVKADPQMLGLSLAMLAGLVFALFFQIFGNTKPRALHFWSAYLFGSIAINAQVYYHLYLTYFA